MLGKTPRTTLQRIPERAGADLAVAYAILDEGVLCHVGVERDGYPHVMPMAYARDSDDVLLHGSSASRLMNALAAGAPASFCVTLLDGMVLARSVFHHSMNFRSLVAFGRARLVDDDGDKIVALARLVEHLVPGRSEDARRPNLQELAATTVVKFPLAEASVKMRAGPPADADKDMSLPIWAGVIPMALAAGTPLADPSGSEVPATPAYVENYARRRDVR